MTSLEPTIPDTTDDARWTWRVVALIACVLPVRLVYAALVPLDLVPDEAYYWDWSRNLDWGYYSKPPMIAWVIAGSTRLLGDSAFAVRLPAVLLSSLGLGFVFLFARRMYDARCGFWACAATAACPGAVVGGLLMTIDAPLLFCWSGSLYCVWQMLNTDRGRWRWLLPATLLTGCGFLSKQTMLAVPALVGLFVLCDANDRRELGRPWLWAWGLGSLLFLTPVVWWNARHGWITLEHTSHHFGSETVTLGKRLGRVGEYIAGQYGVVSPVTCGLIACLMIAALIGVRELGRRERFLFLLGGLPLFGVLVLSFKQRIQPNWPAPFYVTSLVLLAAWATGHVSVTWLDARRPLFRRGLVLGAVLAGLTYLVPFVMSPTGLAGSAVDPTVRLRGWERLAARVQSVRGELPRQDRTFVLAATDRSPVSELAFYLPDQPHVYRFNFGNRIDSQHELWPRPNEVGWDSLILTPADVAVPPSLTSSFDRISPRGTVEVPLGHGRHLRYDVHHAEHFRGWPMRSPLAERTGSTSRL